MSKFKFIFLDLDDTVFDFHASEGAALRGALSELGIEPTPEVYALYSKINRGQWERLERGEATRDEILIRRFELLFEELGINRSPKAAQIAYESRLSREFVYVEGAKELIEELCGKYKLYLASNGTAKVQDGRIALSGIAKYFDGVFISERIGYNKPSREFFERCFESIPDFDKEAAIIVGDSLTSDILGGINAGIKTCLYNPKGKPTREDIIPDYKIKSLGELLKIIEN